MVTTTIEQWLNYLIPIGIVIFFLVLFMSKPNIREGMAWLGAKLKQFGLWIREKLTGEVVETQQIVYG